MAQEEPDDPDFDDHEIDPDDDEMAWEFKVRVAIQEVLDEVQCDEIRGVIYTQTSKDDRSEGYDSIEAFLSTLVDVDDEQWYAKNMSYEMGVGFASQAYAIAERLADEHGLLDFFDRVKPLSDGDKLSTARELLLPKAGLILQVDLSDINDELIKYLAKHPELMHDMEPRKFEELVAALFRAKGFHVELTPATRDGGFDMRAFQRKDIGLCLTLIECKRYAPDHRVSVDVVRGLYGVTENEGATTGLLVTTSSFTKDARSFQDQNRYRIHLADHAELQKWLNEHRRTQ